MTSKRTYKEVSTDIANLGINTKKKVSVFILSVIISLLIVAGPIAVCVNLMVYNDLKKLLVLLIATFLIVFVILLDTFYLIGITEGKVKSLSSIILFDSLIVALVIYILMLIIFFLGVF